jgi:c-di-GMP-binding flagellar brake protein YcgR
MLQRILEIVSGKSDAKKGKKQAQCFSLDFCKIDALVPPNSPISIQHITRDDVIFKAGIDLEENRDVTIVINYHPIRKKNIFETFDTRILIVNKGQLAEKKYLYKAKFASENDQSLRKFYQYLKDVESTQLQELVDYHDRRECFRLNRILPVVSKSLKGYKALTKNISCGGLQFTCGGGIKKGDVISLKLDLDDYHADPISLTGEVQWVDESMPGEARVGLKFIELSNDQKKLLYDYIEGIRKIMKGR